MILSGLLYNREIMKKNKYIYFIPFLCCLLSCSDTPVPKPAALPRIELPEHSYKLFSKEECPFEFEFPSGGEIIPLSGDQCWFDIYYKQFDCKWHITYRNFKAEKATRSVAFEEYRKLIYKHSKKATQINETPLTFPAGDAVLFEIYGSIATPAQFFFCDSTQNLIETSFYFNIANRNDSLAPVIDFMKQDLHHMMSTLKWK